MLGFSDLVSKSRYNSNSLVRNIGKMIVGVAGASGNVGGLVVQRLLDRPDITQVIALSRRSLDFSTYETRQPDQRYMDYNDLDSLFSALDGLDVLVFPGSDGIPDEMLVHHRHVVSAISKCQVGHVVYLSTQGASEDTPFPYASVHYATENLLRLTGAVVSVLRASIFTEFFIQSFLKPAIADGTLCLPTPTGSVAFVSRVDIAAALAAAVVLETESSVVDITGPKSLTMHEVVSEVTAITGKNLQLKVISEDVYRAKLMQQHYEPWLIEAFTTMMSSLVPNQAFQNVSSAMIDLTGNEAQSVAVVLRLML